jgi:galactitol-specific phosphotransferase system IIB component
MKKIGIEKGLDNVADYLSSQGYQVQVLSESIDNNVQLLSGLDAIVTAGYNTDMMGISDTETKAPVINAKGLSPEEIKQRLDRFQ